MTLTICVCLFDEQLGETARGDEHGEGRHERHDPSVGDDDAVDEPGGGADRERDDAPSAARWLESAAACTADSVATTVARPITEPTERSMPPAVMTKVMPMLMTPMTDA